MRYSEGVCAVAAPVAGLSLLGYLGTKVFFTGSNSELHAASDWDKISSLQVGEWGLAEWHDIAALSMTLSTVVLFAALPFLLSQPRHTPNS